MLKKLEKGSLTVEAAFLFPILFFIMAIAIMLGIDLYREIDEASEGEIVRSMWMVDDFYRYEGTVEVLQEEGEEWDD